MLNSFMYLFNMSVSNCVTAVKELKVFQRKQKIWMELIVITTLHEHASYWCRGQRVAERALLVGVKPGSTLGQVLLTRYWARRTPRGRARCHCAWQARVLSRNLRDFDGRRLISDGLQASDNCCERTLNLLDLIKKMTLNVDDTVDSETIQNIRKK